MRESPRPWAELLSPEEPARRTQRDETDEALSLRVAAAEDLAGFPVWSVQASYTATRPCRVALRIGTDLDGEPWWLLPGCFYGENRPLECERVYPRFDAHRHAPEQLVSPRWEFRNDRLATRSVFAWGEDGGLAWVRHRNSHDLRESYGFASEHGRAAIWVTVPYREEPVTYVGSATPEPADVTWVELDAGETVTVTADLIRLPHDRHSYAPVLQQIRSEEAADHRSNPWLTPDLAAELTAGGLVDWHYDPDPGVLLETAGFDRALTGQDGRSIDRQAMHVGWVSGMPWLHALMRHGRRTGNQRHIDAAAHVIDTICRAISPSGTFYGTWYRAGGWKGSWTPLPRGVHARTLGEAALFLQRLLTRFPDLDAGHPSWREALNSNIAVFMDRQRDDGNLGAVHDYEDGSVLSWLGSAGLIWVAVLAERAMHHDDARALDAAVRAGEYYAHFVEQEFIHGAPEDVDLAPTSEDGYNAVMAYVALHRATGGSRWLDLARAAAEWTLTFRYSWNVDFEPHTILRAYDYRTVGGDQASPSNQHLHDYGLICHAELVQLAELSGTPHFAEQARAHLDWALQFIARSDGDFNARRGMVSERFYQTNCFEPKGSILTLSHAWCVGAILLACEEDMDTHIPSK